MFKKIVAMFLVVVIGIAGLAGCKQDKNKTIKFDKMDDDKRQEYVLKYIKDKYQLDGTIRDPINTMQFYYGDDGDTYFACVETSDFNKICCWINKDGTIVDNSYVLGMKDNLEKMFSPIISSYFDNCKIVPVVFMQNQKKPWEVGQEEEMLKEETSLFVELYLFVNTSEAPKFQKAADENFGNKLNFANGTINVAFVSDINNIDLTKRSMTDYDVGFGFAKDVNRDVQ